MQTIVIAVNDLIFAIKARDAVVRAGMAAVIVNNDKRAWEAVSEEPRAAGLILDLNDHEVRPFDLIRRLKMTNVTAGVSILSFLPHVQTELRTLAQEAGSDLVVARSGLVTSLKNWLHDLGDQ